MIGLKSEARGNNWNIIKLAEWGEGGTLKPMQARKRTRETRGRYILGWTSSNHSKGAAA